MEKQATPEELRGPGAGKIAGSRLGSHSPQASTVPVSPSVNPHAPIGAQLAPVLRKVCDGRLSSITWFRTDWQRGGAVTGYATYRDEADRETPVVVKLPVPPRERQWLVRLQSHENVVPRVYQHGDELGSYDFAWVVMERLPHGPLGHAWDGREFDLLIEAVARFYAAAAAHNLPVDEDHVVRKDWLVVYEEARKHLTDLPNEQRWRQAFKRAHRHLKDWVRLWESRPIEGYIHGDVHFANALTRVEPPHGPAVLIDLAEVRPGHWLEDAVYFEHLFWARRHRLEGRRLCSQIAHERKRLGLHVEPDWPRLAQVRRALVALSTPAMLEHDGDPHHVQAALEVLEMAVGGG